jgi:thioredoxin reductase (NADPH)
MTELDKDEQFYRDTESIAFPKLDDRQLAMLEPLGARRIVRRGELVYKAGQRNLGLTVVLCGELEVFESRDGQRANPRDFWPARFHWGRCDAHGHRIGATYAQ